jgi:hypothetical protein
MQRLNFVIVIIIYSHTLLHFRREGGREGGCLETGHCFVTSVSTFSLFTVITHSI